MKVDTIASREDLLIRRATLEPGEATPWHSDACHRFTVVVRGEKLRIEFRDEGDPIDLEVHAGMAGWDEPEDRVHRGVNAAIS